MRLLDWHVKNNFVLEELVTKNEAVLPRLKSAQSKVDNSGTYSATSP